MTGNSDKWLDFAMLPDRAMGFSLSLLHPWPGIDRSVRQWTALSCYPITAPINSREPLLQKDM